jgi:hypothetical protein
MAFYELVLVMCLSSDPGACRERRLTVEAETLVEDCMELAGRKVEAITAYEPDWRTVAWRCEFPDVLSSLREPEAADPEGKMITAKEMRQTDPPDEPGGRTSPVATEDEIFEDDPTMRDVEPGVDPDVDGEPVDRSVPASTYRDIAPGAGRDPGIVAGHTDETATPAP